MNKNQYREFVLRALEQFEEIADELEEDHQIRLQEWNDHFMLELYSVTQDRRTP